MTDGGELAGVDRAVFGAVTALSTATLVQDAFLFSALRRFPAVIATCAIIYGLTFLCLSVVSRSTRVTIHVRRWSLAAGASAILGGMAWQASLSGELFLPLVLVANVLVSIGRAWALCLSAVALRKRSMSCVLMTVALGISCSYFFVTLSADSLSRVAVVLYASMAPLALLFVGGRVEGDLRGRPLAVAPRELEVTNPFSFPGITTRLYVCIAVFETAFGLFLQLSSGRVAIGQAAACSMTMFILVWLTVRLSPQSLIDTEFDLSACMLMGAVVLMTLGSDAPVWAVSILGTIGPQTFRAVTWGMLVAIASRNPSGALPAVARGFGVSGVCAGVGVGLRAAIAAHGEVSQGAAFVLVTVLLFVFLWFPMRRFSFAAAIGDIVGVRPIATPVPAGPEGSLCSIASEHGLTERESEVFFLLARGRNARYIQENLHITRNTAKTHVRHIYQKLEVHTQQELIDTVDHGRAPSAARSVEGSVASQAEPSDRPRHRPAPWDAR